MKRHLALLVSILMPLFIGCNESPKKITITKLKETNNPLLKLTPAETKAYEQREMMMSLARQANKANGSKGGLIPGAIRLNPLEGAIVCNDIGRVKVEIRKGADLNEPAVGYCKMNKKSGYRALHIAVVGGKINIAKLLVKLGADKRVKTGDGKTALDLAKEKGNQAIIDILNETSKN